jgi:putative DNA primase/helicase
VKRNYAAETLRAATDVGEHINGSSVTKDFCLTQLRAANDENGATLVETAEHLEYEMKTGLATGQKRARANGNGQAVGEEPKTDARPVIEIVAGDIAETTSRAEQALIDAKIPFYVRGGKLFRPVIDNVQAADGKVVQAAQLVAVTTEYVIDKLSSITVWKKHDARAKSGLRIVDPPRAIADTLLARHGDWKFPALTGIITCPTLRPDGSTLSTPGYDRTTQLLLVAPPEMPEIVSVRENAELALDLLLALLKEFPFAEKVDRSVALSALMTVVLRGAIEVAPMHLITAPQRGSGKSFLADLASALAIGQYCPVLAACKSEEEIEKRLIGALLRGLPVISLDNLSVDPSGDTLCQAIERPLISLRPLGGSDIKEIASRASIFGTGNNLAPRGDMVRRCLRLTLDANMERPELRAFTGDPREAILANRGKYIAAVLTITQAYLKAGCPAKTTPLASFAGWSRLVREPLIWLRQEDPLKSMDATSEEDPELILFRNLMAELKEALAGQGMTAGEIKDLAEKDKTSALFRAVYDAAGYRGEIDSRRLGHSLKRYDRRMVGPGAKFWGSKNTDKKQKVWRITQTATAGSACL